MADQKISGAAMRFTLALAGMLLIVAALLYFLRPSEDIPLVDANTPPELLREVFIAAEADTLEPFGMAEYRDTLWVVFKDDHRVAALDSQFALIGWVTLEATSVAAPLATGWDVDSLHFYRAEHRSGAVEVFDRDGRLLHRWDRRPDDQPMQPFSLDLFGGNLYVGDVASGRVLAISVRNDPPLTEMGELILTIPVFGQEEQRFGFISGVTCTPDGRVLIGDSDPAGIRVFTCDGRFVYDFSQPIDAPLGARQVAFDGVQFPDLADRDEFDPASTVAIGRLHVVDSRRNIIYVYDPFGRWRFCYGSAEHLEFPSAILTQPGRRRLVVADTGNRRLIVYRW